MDGSLRWNGLYSRGSKQPPGAEPEVSALRVTIPGLIQQTEIRKLSLRMIEIFEQEGCPDAGATFCGDVLANHDGLTLIS